MDLLAVWQLFRDVENEEDWIREKEPIINSTNRGRDLICVQIDQEASDAVSRTAQMVISHLMTSRTA